jgi:hypothetical protein
MITQEISRQIFNCHQEIKSAKAMIEELKKKLDENGELKLKDTWGNERGLELRIPNEGSSWSIHQVPFHLALDVIQEHIANQEKELLRLREVCRIQLA